MAEPGVHGFFFTNAVLHGAESEKQGRPVYIDQHWIRITIAGQDKDVMERKVQPQDKERFSEEWTKYEKGQAQAKMGTPLDMWPRMTPGLVATLKALNILSVEDLATLSDLGCQKIGLDGYKLRDDAQKYLNAASQTSAVMELERLQATCGSQAEELARQAQQIAELTALVKEAVAREGVKPRKRKQQEAAA